VFGGISAAAGIASAIGTFRLEGTMNAVEENTRFGMIHTLSILDKVNEFIPNLKHIHDRWIEFLNIHAWRIHDVWEVLGEVRDEIKYSLVPPMAALAAAGGPVVNVYVTLDGKALTASVMTEVADTLRSGGQQL
jgi:hypothetical protein